MSIKDVRVIRLCTSYCKYLETFPVILWFDTGTLHFAITNLQLITHGWGIHSLTLKCHVYCICLCNLWFLLKWDYENRIRCSLHVCLNKLSFFCRAHYNVILRSVEVGGHFLNLPTDVFDTDNNRGTIIDSGTTLAYLPSDVYEQILQRVCPNLWFSSCSLLNSFDFLIVSIRYALRSFAF